MFVPLCFSALLICGNAGASHDVRSSSFVQLSQGVVKSQNAEGFQLDEATEEKLVKQGFSPELLAALKALAQQSSNQCPKNAKDCKDMKQKDIDGACDDIASASKSAREAEDQIRDSEVACNRQGRILKSAESLLQVLREKYMDLKRKTKLACDAANDAQVRSHGVNVGGAVECDYDRDGDCKDKLQTEGKGKIAAWVKRACDAAAAEHETYQDLKRKCLAAMKESGCAKDDMDQQQVHVNNNRSMEAHLFSLSVKNKCDYGYNAQLMCAYKGAYDAVIDGLPAWKNVQLGHHKQCLMAEFFVTGKLPGSDDEILGDWESSTPPPLDPRDLEVGGSLGRNAHLCEGPSSTLNFLKGALEFTKDPEQAPFDICTAKGEGETCQTWFTAGNKCKVGQERDSLDSIICGQSEGCSSANCCLVNMDDVGSTK